MTISKMQAAAAAAVPSADDAYAEPLFQRKGRKWSKPKDK
jgi:hypothetical protein